MKRNRLYSALLLILLCSFASCKNKQDNNSNSNINNTSNEISSNIQTSSTIENSVLSVKEVLQLPDNTYVTFKGIVTGFDYGKRHIIIEDEDGSCAIQLYKNPSYGRVKVGDKVEVSGNRTFDKSLDRITPDSLDIISSNHPSSSSNPIVIDAKDLTKWTNDNRENSNILFKTYLFTNVTILEKTNSYTYIDNKYDEVGGRGIKIGIKNDSSYCDISDLNLVIGEKYNIKAIAYGISDDFNDESLQGIVIRLSILSLDDVQIITEASEKAKILVTGQRSFLLNEITQKPDLTTYFQVIDPIDGNITVTTDMINEEIDITKEGIYPVSFAYTNSIQVTSSITFDLFISENGVSVTQALKYIDEGTDLHVRGVVIGYSYDGSKKNAMVIEDSENGNAIEMWVKSNAALQTLNVGDDIVIYSSNLAYEKKLPRLSGTLTLKKVIANDSPLYQAKEIGDLTTWSNEIKEQQNNIYGRYTFNAAIIEKGSKYSYFLKSDNSDNHIVQIALHNSCINYNFEVGVNYKLTVVVVGISDSYDDLSNKSITVRLSIMNESDITLIENNSN